MHLTYWFSPDFRFSRYSFFVMRHPELITSFSFIAGLSDSLLAILSRLSCPKWGCVCLFFLKLGLLVSISISFRCVLNINKKTQKSIAFCRICCNIMATMCLPRLKQFFIVFNFFSCLLFFKSYNQDNIFSYTFRLHSMWRRENKINS